LDANTNEVDLQTDAAGFRRHNRDSHWQVKKDAVPPCSCFLEVSTSHPFVVLCTGKHVVVSRRQHCTKEEGTMNKAHRGVFVDRPAMEENKRKVYATHQSTFLQWRCR
jgi:hypothetical protein